MDAVLYHPLPPPLGKSWLSQLLGLLSEWPLAEHCFTQALACFQGPPPPIRWLISTDCKDLALLLQLEVLKVRASSPAPREAG